MNKEDVIKAIKEIRSFNSETSQIEVKSALKGFPKKCYDTFSSFANTDGGTIIFGLDEKNKFKTEGVYDINDLQKKVSSLCSDALDPSLKVNMLPIEFEGKNILVVYVPEIKNKPCYYKQRGINGGSYTRVGDSDRPLTNYEVLNYQVFTYKKYLDILPCMSMSIDDLDREKINQYLNKISSLKSNFSKLSFEEQLE